MSSSSENESDTWETISSEIESETETENFHVTFLDILFGRDPLDTRYNDIKEYVNFKFNFNLLPKCSDTVEQIAPYLLQSMKKEQELIDTTKDYYIARDLIDNTIYICFKELMVIDIDVDETSTFNSIDKIIKHFSEIPNSSFRIYGRKDEENNFCAYHVFCTDKKVVYRDKNSIQFMITNFCDFYYTVHSYIRGFCVRLNNKFKTANEYEYICTIINGQEEEDQDLVKLVKLHESLIKKYKIGEICYPKINSKESDNESEDESYNKSYNESEDESYNESDNESYNESEDEN